MESLVNDTARILRGSLRLDLLGWLRGWKVVKCGIDCVARFEEQGRMLAIYLKTGVLEVTTLFTLMCTGETWEIVDPPLFPVRLGGYGQVKFACHVGCETDGIRVIWKETVDLLCGFFEVLGGLRVRDGDWEVGTELIDVSNEVETIACSEEIVRHRDFPGCDANSFAQSLLFNGVPWLGCKRYSDFCALSTDTFKLQDELSGLTILNVANFDARSPCRR
jgi:hypothetical protein